MSTTLMLTSFNNLSHTHTPIVQDLIKSYETTIHVLENTIKELQEQLDYISDNSFKKVRALEKEIEGMKNTVPSTKTFNWNDTCSVCLAQFKQDDKLVITKCNHVFHESCLAQSLTVNSSCPLCRCEL